MQKLVLKNIKSALGLPISEYHRLKMVTDIVREAFSADRCWLLYPCGPTDRDRIIPIESTSEQHPGVSRIKSYDAAAPILQHICELLDCTNQPVAFNLDTLEALGLTNDYAIFNIKAQLVCKVTFNQQQNGAAAIGLHHCETPHAWTKKEIKLLMKLLP